MVVAGGFTQVNQSLSWFVENFALVAEWRAALLRVIKFREALLMSENGCGQENRTVHLRDFADHPKSPNRVVKVTGLPDTQGDRHFGSGDPRGEGAPFSQRIRSVSACRLAGDEMPPLIALGKVGAVRCKLGRAVAAAAPLRS